MHDIINLVHSPTNTLSSPWEYSSFFNMTRGVARSSNAELSTINCHYKTYKKCKIKRFQNIFNVPFFPIIQASTIGHLIVDNILSKITYSTINKPLYRYNSCWYLLGHYVKSSSQYSYPYSPRTSSRKSNIWLFGITLGAYLLTALKYGWNSITTWCIAGGAFATILVMQGHTKKAYAKEKMKHIHKNLQGHPGFTPVHLDGRPLGYYLSQSNAETLLKYGVDGENPLSHIQLINNINKEIEDTFNKSLEDPSQAVVHPLVYLLTDGILHPYPHCGPSLPIIHQQEESDSNLEESNSSDDVTGEEEYGSDSNKLYSK